MKLITQFRLSLIFILIVNVAFAQKSGKLSKDFNTLTGCWQGNLTYLDYSTNKPFSMPANLEISQIAATDNFAFSNIYPKEPQANSIDTVIISNDKKTINNEMVNSKTTLKDGSLRIITEEKGTDGNDNKPATFRHTYIIGKNIYSNKKEVQFSGSIEWITRHEFSYKRCN